MMTDKLRAAAKAALNWLEGTKTQSVDEYMRVVDSLKAALAEPEQEPMLEMNPEKRPWVGLTGTEINHIFSANVGYPERMMKEVEALLREKNT